MVLGTRAGLGTGSMHSPGYSATKAGVIRLTPKNSLYQMVPSGRLGHPDEYANVPVFLAAQNH